MKAEQAKWYRRHYDLLCGVLITFVVLWGGFTAWATYRQGFDLGDAATYYALARGIDHGEIVYKDFVHFKTPAASFLEAATIKAFGDSQSSVMIGIKLEINVLYPAFFLIGTFLLFRRSRNPLFCFLAAFGVLWISPIAGLRAGFAFLAVCIYLTSFDYTGRRRDLRLLAAGAMSGVAFMFGQDMFLLAATTIGTSELFNWRSKDIFQRLKWLIGGVVAGAAPLLIYVLVLSNISTFLYYVGYYGLVLQPKFMNTPFPTFGFASLVYYVPFMLYFMCFMQLSLDGRSNRRDALLLSFGILRLVTALGRSDFGHVLFSIPELFVIVPYFMSRVITMRTNRHMARSIAPYAIVLLLVFWIGIVGSSTVLIVVPFICLMMLRQRNGALTKLAAQALRFNLYSCLASLAVLFVFMLYPALGGFLRGVKTGAFDGVASPKIDGMSADPVTYQEVEQVRNVVNQYHPDTIFSFPIQAYFYSMAPHMATRFVTFEPETTLKEQNQAIADLQKSKPGVVLLDVLEAQGMPNSNWKMVQYVTNHYQIKHYVTNRDIWWVMTPRHDKTGVYPLVFQTLKDNPLAPAGTNIQLHDQGIDNAVYQAGKTLRYAIEPSPHSTTLRVGVLVSDYIAASTTAQCGSVVITANHASHATRLCSADGQQNITLPKNASVTITLTNLQGTAIVWNSPEIVTKY